MEKNKSSKTQSLKKKKEKDDFPLKRKKHQIKVDPLTHDSTLLLTRILSGGSILNTTPLSQLISKRNKTSARIAAKFVLGTQEPVLRLRTATTVIQSNGSGNIFDVIQADFTGIVNWTSLIDIFDEVQLQKVSLHFVQSHVGFLTSANPTPVFAGPCAVVVDYDDNAALSFDDAISYDTMKIWHLTGIPSKLKQLHAFPQGIPDKSWSDTASTTVPIWFKFANSVSFPANTSVGRIYLEFVLRFRQVTA